MRRFLFLAALLSFFPSLSQAATFWVRADGNNGNSGATDTAGGAFLTLSQCHTAMAAGDVCNVSDGGGVFTQY